MDSLKHHIVLFITMIMFMSATMSRAQKTTTVVINNDLGSGLSLGYHCKSGDNDLGYGSLGVGGSWFFRFKPDIFGRTLFFCRFSWGNESHYFDIYKQKRDREFEKFGCTHCEWKIRKNGPCKLNKITNKFDVCLPWKS
ncbi:hypothetical protein Bca52824_049872 [Brassica carinata]|uniref:S-protein homolog n=1 Tax=Brassica carinata TaxID=52824 RepID=A0A8X7RNE7_BRACI|nr:hypothetical protein Bca52824_049872 [Brassica carinata]